MSRPLYILRAERELACEKLIEILSWYAEQADVERNVEALCICGESSWKNERWITSRINDREYRSRGELLIHFSDLVDAINAVYNAERLEAAKLIACGGKVA